ncbi:TetR/AcrR family transcriptional regulator [Thalassolituus sp. LLYu03]|uniref:TetR/AcrR family transcriptional regulator n=1 Tax=Thalassolituus sp. LLYu03 TaxID=3421656 RepID=UPI003D2A9A9A
MNDCVTDAPVSSYHHGNLREALLDAAVVSIREQGADKLSLRALARSVGVSQTAPYRHFADKNELLVELARQAFDEIAEATTACITPDADCHTNMQAAGEAYLRYAISHPEKYRLLFGTTIDRREQYPQLMASGHRAFEVLVKLIDEGVQRGEFIQEPVILLSNICWSGIHGFASLWIDGIFARRQLPTDLETMLTSQIRATVRSISTRPATVIF